MKNIITLILLSGLLVGCASYRYKGDGDYDEYTRTYVPVIGVSKGFIIAMPEFSPTTDIEKTYKLGRLPQYHGEIFVDLLTTVFDQLPSDEEIRQAVENIPGQHKISCTLIDTKTGSILLSSESKIASLPTMGNPMLKRPFILNVMQIHRDEIPSKAELELKMQYLIGEKPVNREMILSVSMNPPYL